MTGTAYLVYENRTEKVAVEFPDGTDEEVGRALFEDLARRLAPDVLTYTDDDCRLIGRAVREEMG